MGHCGGLQRLSKVGLLSLFTLEDTGLKSQSNVGLEITDNPAYKLQFPEIMTRLRRDTINTPTEL